VNGGCISQLCYAITLFDIRSLDIGQYANPFKIITPKEAQNKEIIFSCQKFHNLVNKKNSFQIDA
jgi:hypothetical protein